VFRSAANVEENLSLKACTASNRASQMIVTGPGLVKMGKENLSPSGDILCAMINISSSKRSMHGADKKYNSTFSLTLALGEEVGQQQTPAALPLGNSPEAHCTEN